MADDVQRLLLQIDASATLLRQEVAKARNDIDGFADRGAAKLKKIDAGFAGIGIAANAATARIAGFAAGLLTVGQAASFMVRANADMQRLSAMLEVATGSAGSAATAMSQLQAFAAETPFTLGQVTEAYIKLKNLGLDPSVDAMRSFGNTSAAMGKDLMQFIEAVADASTGQFERLWISASRPASQANRSSLPFRASRRQFKTTRRRLHHFCEAWAMRVAFLPPA
jgi:phage tail tape-measure protein